MRGPYCRDVSANLLTELQTQIAEAHTQSSDERHPLTIRELAERVQLPLDRLTELLGALEAPPKRNVGGSATSAMYTSACGPGPMIDEWISEAYCRSRAVGTCDWFPTDSFLGPSVPVWY